ncbi:MAG: hypothetical protein QE271_07070 [Bacteriovoracaceae bacterium]|nr:hypothetical protein [Bacteriovoracaceae bacterium]
MKSLMTLGTLIAVFSWSGHLMAQKNYELHCLIQAQGTNDWIIVKEQVVDVVGQTDESGFTGHATLKFGITTKKNQHADLEATTLVIDKEMDVGGGIKLPNKNATVSVNVSLKEKKVTVYDFSLDRNYMDNPEVHNGTVSMSSIAVKFDDTKEVYRFNCETQIKK